MDDMGNFDIREFLGNEVKMGRRSLVEWSPEEPDRLISLPTDLVCLTSSGHPKFLIPLNVFLEAIADSCGLEQSQVDTVACLAPEWDGSWGQLIVAAQTL